MKRSVWIILPLLLMLALTGCQPSTISADSAEGAASDGAVVDSDAVGLAGTRWVMSSLGGDLPLPGATLTLNFGDDGSVSGSDGCNQFNTTYVQSVNNLTIAQPGAMTMMACSAAIMNQAESYLGALAGTTTFTALGDQLILMDGNQILATFVSMSQALHDTTWEVISYNNGRDAVVSLIVGSEIDAIFDAEGYISGNAGCNNYIAGFTVQDNQISVDTPASTFRFCDSPPGVMEQEAEYLAALERATTYEVQGNLLQMRRADDQLAVIMTRRFDMDLPEPDPDVPWGRVTSPSGVNVRSGPGVNFPVIGTAHYNDEGEIVGRNANSTWWAVAAPSIPEGIGWVSADFVVAVGAEDVPIMVVALPPAPEPTAVPPATPTPVPAATATPSAQISFSADRTTIDQGQCATLQWSGQNVQAVWVYPQGSPYYRHPRALQGSEQVCPPVTTTYEMRILRRDGGTEVRQVTVTVNATAEPQISFWAERTSIQQGECTMLRWNVENVQGVWVYPQGERPERFPRVGNDSERVCPPTTTTYEMRVQMRDDSMEFRQVTISVLAPTPTPAPPAPVNPLAGSRWSVVQFNNGSVITTLIDGSNIAIEFDGDSQIAGNSGCNSFNGSYQVSNNSLSVSQLAGGMMNCEEPEGVMQQEALFQSALQSAATFRIDGNRLEIQNGAGQIVVFADRAP